MPFLEIDTSIESKCLELESDIRNVVITNYILDNIATEKSYNSNVKIIYENDGINNEEVY